MTTGPANDSATQAFLDRAYPRMIRFSFVLAGIGAVAAFAVWGTAVGIGFGLGSIVAILNFVWLHHGAQVLIGRMLSERNTASRFRMTLGFLGRYTLVGLIAYAIFKSSAQAFGAFLAALPLPIVAAMCEAAYEAFLNVKDPDSANT